MTTRVEALETISLEIHSNKISELDYVIRFRHIQGNNPTDAIVETYDFIDPVFNSNFDARFGDRTNPNNPLDPLESTRILSKGLLAPYVPLTTHIFPDVRPEEDECYTINIFTEIHDSRPRCNDNPDDFFCDHTVCILNDDGKLRLSIPVDTHAHFCISVTGSTKLRFDFFTLP